MPVDVTAIAVVAIVFGTGASVVSKFLETIGGRKREVLVAEARAAQERVRSLEAQLVDSHRLNDTLQKQLEWHTKMLETQDKLMKQLTDGAGSRPTVGSTS